MKLMKICYLLEWRSVREKKKLFPRSWVRAEAKAEGPTQDLGHGLVFCGPTKAYPASSWFLLRFPSEKPFVFFQWAAIQCQRRINLNKRVSKLARAFSYCCGWVSLVCSDSREIRRIDVKLASVKNTIILFVCPTKILHKHCFQLLLGPL